MSAVSRRAEVAARIQALQAELVRLESVPDQPSLGSVVKFTRTFAGGRSYTYAAIKATVGGTGWYRTGSDPEGGVCRVSWEALVDIADPGSIRLMVEADDS